MLKKTAFVGLWFGCGIIAIFLNLYILNFNFLQKKVIALNKPFPHSKIQSSLNENSGQVLGTQIVSEDGRIYLLERFMTDTPLGPYAKLMVDLADEHGIDYRLLPAIAMCESNLGKRIPTSDSYNAWGIGVFTGQQEGTKFSNWKSAIEWVYAYVSDRYVSRNLTELIDIGGIWAPPSLEKGNSWANCVANFMSEIE